ncbi:hypothetical protein E4L95_16590 [Paracoccus liaowanqingii]|uniref:ParB/Sulfiredoxin domain-containing protein n=1 Tax=Paracoccus liaowanqingii TaxID=2560053 RepID=A0A4Z1CEJ7_9RHOB|nr:hypothetical protein [Paracoccus liaowanqingii]TGN51826.1 hypothetical protein E4L95_16590 [Paracoccus liaowanqingii]
MTHDSSLNTNNTKTSEYCSEKIDQTAHSNLHPNTTLSTEQIVNISDVVFHSDHRSFDFKFRPLEDYKISDLRQDLINRSETWFDNPPQLWDLCDGTYMVCDGRHRVAAYAELGIEKFPAKITKGNIKIANSLIHRDNSMPGWKYDGKQIAQILWEFIMQDYDIKNKTMKRGKGKGEEYTYKTKELSHILGISESTVEKRRRVLRNYVESGKEPPKLWWQAAQRQDADELDTDVSAEEYAEQFRELVSINERSRIQSNNPLARHRSQWAEAALSQCSEDEAKRLIMKYFRVADGEIIRTTKTKFLRGDAIPAEDCPTASIHKLFEEKYFT